MDKLSQEQVDRGLADFPEWSQLNESISRTYQLENFLRSIDFVNAVAEAAEQAQHHPDILIRWNKVTLTLSTHDAGGLTQLDFDLAGRADSLAAELERSQ